MAISAARSDLTIAVTGTDETTEMLSKARDQIAALEDRMKSLKTTGDAQNKTAMNQVRSLQSLNTSMAGAAQRTESVVDGVDKWKNALGKVVGSLGFVGAAVTTAVAIWDTLADALSGTSAEAEKTAKEIDKIERSVVVLTASTRGYIDEAKKFAAQSKVVTVGMKELTEAESLRMDAQLKRLTDPRNGELEARMLERDAEELEFAEKIAVQQNVLNEAKDKYNASLKATEIATAAIKELELDQWKLKEQAIDLSLLEGEETKEAIKRNEIKRDGVNKELKAQKEIVETMKLQRPEMAFAIGQQELYLLKLLEIQKAMPLRPFNFPDHVTDPSKDKDEPTKPRGSPGPRQESATERSRRIARQEREELQRQIRANREFTAQVMENSKLREEREQAEFKFAEQVAEQRKKFQEADERNERLDKVGPVIDLANALSQHLGPALNFVEQSMQQVADVFQSFVDGQTSLVDAVAGSAHAITRAVAEQVGGVKALAAFDAAYHLYKGFGTAFTNPAESAGHFIAAAGLGLVAAGIIPTGTAGAKKPDQRGGSRREESQASDTGEKTVVYNISAGVMDGQSVSRAVRQSERSSRGTGYSARGV